MERFTIVLSQPTHEELYVREWLHPTGCMHKNFDFMGQCLFRIHIYFTFQMAFVLFSKTACMLCFIQASEVLNFSLINSGKNFISGTLRTELGNRVRKTRLGGKC